MGHPVTAVPLTPMSLRAMAGPQEMPQRVTVPLGPVMAMRAEAAERRSAVTARLTGMAASAGHVTGAGATAAMRTAGLQTPGTAARATGVTARPAMAATDRSPAAQPWCAQPGGLSGRPRVRRLSGQW